MAPARADNDEDEDEDDVASPGVIPELTMMGDGVSASMIPVASSRSV